VRQDTKGPEPRRPPPHERSVLLSVKGEEIKTPGWACLVGGGSPARFNTQNSTLLANISLYHDAQSKKTGAPKYPGLRL
jgi:hypothetical protein